MKRKATTRVFAVLLSAAVLMPAAQMGGLAVFAKGTASAWSVSLNDSVSNLPEDAAKAFEDAMNGYTGAKLTALACYGTQVVAGRNYYLICRDESTSQLKEVVIYQDPSEKSTVSTVEDFNLSDYAKDHSYPLPDYPECGGVEAEIGQKSCQLPAEVQTVFDKEFADICGVSYTPLAYLGKQTLGDGTDYALLCEHSAVVANPDIFVGVTVLHENTDGTVYIKSNYDLIGLRTDYQLNDGKLTYAFKGNSQTEAGYAEGSITLNADKDGTYKLYWADTNGALEGYYPIGELKLKAGKSGTVDMGYHTVIPDGATAIIATTGSLSTSDAYAVYSIPNSKRFNRQSGSLLYSFSTYSDIHIDKGSLWYVNAEKNFKQALKYSTSMGADYIIVSGDCVTNDSGPDKEWDAYAKVLSQSDYVNPIWESDGNHDLRQGVESGLKSFIKGSGTDGSQSSKSYFYMEEEKTGDLFVFMSLELNKAPNQADEFSDAQIAWVTDLLEKNYQNHNIFLVQHSPIKGYGAGDRMSKPYYSGLLNPNDASTKKFKALLEKYPNIVFLSGHTHEDFTMDYNYSDESGTSANMIHTPSLAGSTMPDSNDTGLERNEGKGFNSQGYHVDVYENEIVFYGANITDEKIYPKYSYIMEGSRTSASPVRDITHDIALSGKLADGSDLLAKVSYALSSNYKYASYDAYQSLKKLYYEYKSQTQLDEAVIAEFGKRLQALEAYTGEIHYYALYDTYYFTNNKNWSNVYAYAWDGSSHNAEWPGIMMTRVGTNSNGQSVYQVRFENKGQYKNLIFNAGMGSDQTVDIALQSYEYNGFYLNGTDNGKYKVENYSYGTQTEDKIALLYYVTDEHGWANVDTYMTRNDDGWYEASYDATSDKSFSFSLYNKTQDKYYSLSASQKYTFKGGSIFDCTLEKMSSRGKSITIQGLANQSHFTVYFIPDTMQVLIRCRGEIELMNQSYVSAETVKVGEKVDLYGVAYGGTAPYTYALMYRKAGSTTWTKIGTKYGTASSGSFKPGKAVPYEIMINVKDDTGKVKSKTFKLNVTGPLKNTSTVSATTVKAGTTVTLNASATGGQGDYRYALMYKKSGSTTWTKIGTKYGTASTGSFKPGKKVPYDIMINVKDSAGTIKSKTFTLNVT